MYLINQQQSVPNFLCSNLPTICCLICKCLNQHSVTSLIQAKKDPKEVTDKVYFDVEIGGKPAGMHASCDILYSC